MSDLLGSFKERWGPGFAKLPFSKNINQTPQPTNYLKTHMSVCTELTDKGYKKIIIIQFSSSSFSFSYMSACTELTDKGYIKK
jgi:hypothetical protein